GHDDVIRGQEAQAVTPEEDTGDGLTNEAGISVRLNVTRCSVSPLGFLEGERAVALTDEDMRHRRGVQFVLDPGSDGLLPCPRTIEGLTIVGRDELDPVVVCGGADVTSDLYRHSCRSGWRKVTKPLHFPLSDRHIVTATRVGSLNTEVSPIILLNE